MQETETMEQAYLCEVKRRGGAGMWDKKGWGHVGGVNRICCMLQGLCEPCKRIMMWACHCVCVMCTCVD
jgi:hypothetical protein